MSSKKSKPLPLKPSLEKDLESPPKKVKTYETKLSAEELAHLRDLMSIMLPPDGSTTLSQSLAKANGNSMLEARLWSKVTDLCKQAGIPTDDEAPDYAVGVSGVPTLAVYQLQLHETAGADK